MTPKYSQQLTISADCDNLQSDLDNIYLWSSKNNMMFNQEKFQYISYHMGDSSKINNIYLSPDLNILPKSGEVKDLAGVALNFFFH